MYGGREWALAAVCAHREHTTAALREYVPLPRARPPARPPAPQAQQAALAEVREPLLRFLKKRDDKAARKLAKLAAERPSGAAALALTKVGSSRSARSSRSGRLWEWLPLTRAPVGVAAPQASRRKALLENALFCLQ